MGSISEFGEVLDAVKELMDIHFTIWGFEISFWEVFLFGCIAYIMIRVIAAWFLDE